jgi:hypothetical protein
MPIPQNLNLPNTEPKESYLTLDNFKRGVITLIDDSRLPKNALAAADNIWLVEDGQPSTRPGVDWYGTAPTYYSTGTASQSGTTITGSGTTFTASMVGMTITWDSGETALIDTYVSATSVTTLTSQTVSSGTYVINAPIMGVDTYDTGSAVHIVLSAGGNIYRSIDDGITWSLCSGGTVTLDTAVNFNQYNNYLYITTGIDIPLLYDGTTTLIAYVALSTPSAPTAAQTGMAGTLYSYYYKISAVNSIGFSIASAKVTQQVNKPRESWVAASEYITLTLPAYQTAAHLRYDIYFSSDDADYYYLGSSSTPSLSFRDDGTGIPVPSTTAPIANTTEGPLYAELTNVGSRLYGVRDPNNPYRIGFSSGTAPKGAFSSAYDGGYLDWQEGGKQKPVKVIDYRDGKGTPYATVFMNSTDGEGAVIQMSLDTLTIDTVSVTIPSAYKLPGSRGTPAPGSVVNVLNDYMFYNSQAFYNLGSRAQFLNLLSTDEVSANIRPTIKRINSQAEGAICSIYHDAKVFFSVPYGTDNNSHVAIFDTERKAWLPKAFTRGFAGFLKYTATSGEHTLLAYQTGDLKLSQIAEEIQGDYGVAFDTLLVTGLYPTSKNRFDFQYVEEGEVEFSNLQGGLVARVIGIDRRTGYSTIKSVSVTPAAGTTTTGWDTFSWDGTPWDDTSSAVEVYSEPSTKRYFILQKELNAIQWEISTNTIGAKYVLRTLQSHGTGTLAGKPRGWRLT